MRLFSILLLLSVVTPGFAEEKSKGLLAGAYAQDVTPQKFPISVNGGMTDRQAKSANDPLHARCLVLESDNTQLAIVVVDSCMIPREIIDAAKTQANKLTGIPTSNMLISATHTHSAPTLGGVFQSEPDAEYIQYLISKIVEGIQKAFKNRKPARIGWGVAKEPSQLFNRRWKRDHAFIPPDPFGNTTDRVQMNPGYQVKGLMESAGPIDPDVSFVSIQTREGKPIALLANYSLHYVGDLPALSADYFGVFAETISRVIGVEKSDPPFVGIMSNGTSGDVNNINFGGPAPKSGKPGERCRLVAEIVADAIKKVYPKVEYRSDVKLAVSERDIDLGVRKPNEKELAYANDLLEKAKDQKVYTKMPEIYARETTLIAKYPDRLKCKLQVMRIGDLGITAIPCEVFTEIGLEVKKKTPLKHTFTIELANGYNGYLPTPEQHKLGGYETWRARSSYLEINASEKVIETILDLLKTVAK